METSDSALIEESISGNLGAFDALMLKYQSLVYRVSLRYAGEQDSALDITQNVFMKVYENLRSLRRDLGFKPWLMQITYHESINWLRKNRHRMKEDDLKEGEMVATSLNQERSFLEKETGAALIRCMTRLNPRHQMAVMLRYFDEMPISEIATVLHCSEGLVKNILFRSLRRLKREMVRI